MKNYVEIIKNEIFYQAFNDDSLIVINVIIKTDKNVKVKS